MSNSRVEDFDYSILKKRILSLSKDQMALALLAIMDGAEFISALRLAEEKIDDFKNELLVENATNQL